MEQSLQNPTIRYKLLKRLGLVLIIVAIATILDYIAHSTSPAFYVPFEYFRNKVIFATIWGFVTLLVIQKMRSVWLKALIFAGVDAVLLQIKYFIQGYDLFFVFLFLFLHFIMLFVPAIVIIKRYPRVFS